jgi:hypothetical protein
MMVDWFGSIFVRELHVTTMRHNLAPPRCASVVLRQVVIFFAGVARPQVSLPLRS